MRKFILYSTLFLFVFVGSAFLISIAAAAPGASGYSGLAAKSVKLGNGDSGITLLDQDENGLTVRMKIGKVEFIKVNTKEGTFFLPRIANFTRSFKVGEPCLPIASKLIAIPFECKLRVKVLDYRTKEVSLPGLLMPVQPPLSKSVDPRTVPFEYNRDIYNTPGKYALPLASRKILGVMRSTRLGQIFISPVEYYPTENRATVYKSVTVRVKFKNPNWKLTKKMKKKYASFFFEPVFRNLLNYKKSDYLRSDLVKYPVKYVIVADRMFEAQLQPFIQWKIKKGFEVFVGYTDTIGTSQSAIKSYIQNLYNTETPAPSFVLFVGDDQQIEAWSGSAGSHITDLRYCEFTGDDLPEIYYGRFSAQNTGELQPQIDKTLEYEQYTMPDPSYLGEVTLVSGVDSGYADPYGNGQINYGTNLYFNAAHGISPHVWLYPASDGSGVPADVRQTVSDGIGFYNYTAHCSHTGPSDPSFTTSDIPNLNNAHKYLLGIGNCCLSNTFGDNYSTPCFGEAWLQAADEGGIGWIGGTNSTYWDEDYWWGVGYGPIDGDGPTYNETGIGAYDGVFHDHGEPVSEHYITNSAIVFAGCSAVTEAGSSRSQYYWEIYHLMGDPSVMTYMGVPSLNTVSHAASMTINDTYFTVQADPGSYVGITKNGVLHGAAYVDSSGSVDVQLTALGSTGTAIVMVTCQNKEPYEANVPVTSGTLPPVADFVGSPTSGMVALTVQFTDTSLEGPTSWSWDFGDGGNSTLRNPSHQYTAVGTYTVSMTATNENGSDTETKTDYITVTALLPPVADFTASATTVYEGDTVTFTDQTINNPATWSWTFAGGTPATSTDQNPSVTYNTAGTYTVELTATNAAGSDTETKIGYITVQVPPLEYCTSQGNNYSYEWIENVTVGDINNTSGAAGYTDFTSITGNLTAGENVSVSLTPGFSGTVYTEHWKIYIDYNIDGDFEDANEQVFYQISDTTVTGSFTVPTGISGLTRMRVSMKWDAEQTPCETFSYGEVEDYTINITPGIVDPPVADFSASATTITLGDTVDFTDLSTNTPTSWSWTFAGGTPATSTAQNPSVTYNTAGTYTVALTATNSAGSDTETKVDYITVNAPPPPVADFTASATTIDEGQSVTFSDTSTNNPTSWDWTFAGGTPSSSTAQNPTITYDTAGTYTVTLIATNAGGSDSETKVDYITVNPPQTDEIYVYDITQAIIKKGVNYESTATISIRDTSGAPAAGATVYITWSGVVSGSASGVTAADGTVSFKSSKIKSTGPFTITVTNVTHATLPYNPALNNETSDTAYF